MITAIILSAAMATAPLPAMDAEIRDLTILNDRMQACINDVKAKTIGRARSSCRAALDFSLQTPFSDERTRTVISGMVWTLNTANLPEQGWRP